MKPSGMKRLAHVWRNRRWDQIVPQADDAAAEGHPLSFDYLPRPIRSIDMLERQLSLIEPDIIDASIRYPRCHWSMKPALWGLPYGVELFEQALTRLSVVCGNQGVMLRMDTPPAPLQRVCLDLALKLPAVEPVLAVSEPGFDDHLQLCVDAARRVRLVKGSSVCLEPEYTVSDRMVHSVTVLLQASIPVAVATHDTRLLWRVMDHPSYRDGLLEVEMVSQLVTGQQLQAVPAQMLRLYYPYGAYSGRFFVKRILGSPLNRIAVFRAALHR